MKINYLVGQLYRAYLSKSWKIYTVWPAQESSLWDKVALTNDLQKRNDNSILKVSVTVLQYIIKHNLNYSVAVGFLAVVSTTDHVHRSPTSSNCAEMHHDPQKFVWKLLFLVTENALAASGHLHKILL